MNREQIKLDVATVTTGWNKTGEDGYEEFKAAQFRLVALAKAVLNAASIIMDEALQDFGNEVIGARVGQYLFPVAMVGKTVAILEIDSDPIDGNASTCNPHKS